MGKIATALTLVIGLAATQASAQAVSKVTGAAGSVTGGGGMASSGLGVTSNNMASPSSSAPGGLPTGSAVGGSLPGAIDFKAAGRTMQFRGAAGVGDDRGNFKAGLGIPF